MQSTFYSPQPKTSFFPAGRSTAPRIISHLTQMVTGLYISDLWNRHLSAHEVLVLRRLERAPRHTGRVAASRDDHHRPTTTSRMPAGLCFCPRSTRSHAPASASTLFTTGMYAPAAAPTTPPRQSRASARVTHLLFCFSFEMSGRRACFCMLCLAY